MIDLIETEQSVTLFLGVYDIIAVSEMEVKFCLTGARLDIRRWLSTEAVGVVVVNKLEDILKRTRDCTTVDWKYIHGMQPRNNIEICRASFIYK